MAGAARFFLLRMVLFDNIIKNGIRHYCIDRLKI